jgi:hypothetical protein
MIKVSTICKLRVIIEPIWAAGIMSYIISLVVIKSVVLDSILSLPSDVKGIKLVKFVCDKCLYHQGMGRVLFSQRKDDKMGVNKFELAYGLVDVKREGLKKLCTTDDRADDIRGVIIKMNVLKQDTVVEKNRVASFCGYLTKKNKQTGKIKVTFEMRLIFCWLIK